ncbi:hypothetical protein BATDEDRAFT_86062 [Batrachochytrium dendrobatidis JAM81]|uniref:Uncharacterized protein n=1 Tax=Batrachochytrium dendrobatidis (strain JAM81 / FGSC 10211) TaxID=684364 RepID=F4NVC7_BATDJ|nr:uncharacterized protein BATDEDRAFT_86062 [Batrachochytrium dendrobatidis JAM81]EGF83676.1 hypothetical protein BATDEDRAFT_86062 [Batrachochytrium dendrobatidis JAM81]|eukprot:XP_006676184.1 hypothetical protein BATDEDRAFT_86062 [Batrachochytrium dendrobatidis JAM81]
MVRSTTKATGSTRTTRSAVAKKAAHVESSTSPQADSCNPSVQQTALSSSEIDTIVEQKRLQSGRNPFGILYESESTFLTKPNGNARGGLRGSFGGDVPVEGFYPGSQLASPGMSPVYARSPGTLSKTPGVDLVGWSIGYENDNYTLESIRTSDMGPVLNDVDDGYVSPSNRSLIAGSKLSPSRQSKRAVSVNITPITDESANGSSIVAELDKIQHPLEFKLAQPTVPVKTVQKHISVAQDTEDDDTYGLCNWAKTAAATAAIQDASTSIAAHTSKYISRHMLPQPLENISVIDSESRASYSGSSPLEAGFGSEQEFGGSSLIPKRPTDPFENIQLGQHGGKRKVDSKAKTGSKKPSKKLMTVKRGFKSAAQKSRAEMVSHVHHDQENESVDLKKQTVRRSTRIARGQRHAS